MLVTSLRRLRRRRAQLSLGGIKSGCCCVSTKICLTTCFVPTAGATITITGLGSCVTGADGCCDAPWLTSGSHVFTATDSYGATICSGGGSWTAGATNTKNCTPSDGVCCGAYYIPNVLTATDASGSFAMNYAGTDVSGNPQWEGGYAIAETSSTVSTPGGICTVAAPTSGPVRICYQMTCFASGTPAFKVLRVWPWVNYAPGGGTGTNEYYQDSTGFAAGRCSNGPPISCGSPNISTASGSASSAAATPFGVSFSTSTDPGAAIADPVGGGIAISA